VPRLSLLALLLLTALPLRAEETAPAPDSAPTPACVAPGVWADGTGQTVEPAPLLRRAADQPVILLGEQHDKADHHRWQLHTLAGLHALNPDLAIGLEMLPRRVQPVLDRWVAGELDEATFLAESDWRTLWGFDPGFYTPILHFARLHRLPVVALNVERALIARTARDGWDAVPNSAREGVGTPAPPTDAYRDGLMESLAAHDRPDAPPEAAWRFIEAQTVWDRAMAERIAETRRATGRAVVAILGEGHVDHRNGVPHQLADLGLPDAAVLLPWDADRPCEDLDGRIADAVFGLGPSREAAQPARPRLGIQIDTATTSPATPADGVRIGSVTENGVAAEAGLAAGDQLLTAAGRPIRRPDDLTAIVQRQAPGTWLPITVRRGDATREFVAKFPVER